MPRGDSDEVPIDIKQTLHRAEKVRIATAAVELIRDGETLILDSGTTTAEIAKQIRALKLNSINVITNALNIAVLLANAPHVNLIIPGGILRRKSWSLSGPQAEQALRDLQADHVFLGVDSLDPEIGLMDGAAAWMMEANWDAQYFLLIFLMWAAMMVAMMLPSALPTILIFHRAARNDPEIHSPARRLFAFAAGYMLAWCGFSIVASFLQWGLAEAALLSPMMVSATPWLGGSILIAAGLYQWTPLKSACLRQCRSPLAFIAQYWQPGMPGALQLGLRHGLYCVGCCWALMLLLFVGGVMSLLWIGGITAFVLLEKLAPYGARQGRLSGLALVVAGAWVLISA